LLLADVSIHLCRRRRWQFSVLREGPTVSNCRLFAVDWVRFLSEMASQAMSMQAESA
jgi:hypothetical protein